MVGSDRYGRIIMSGMHLMPVYYSSTKTSRKGKAKKVSAKLQAIRDDHAKFIKKLGVRAPVYSKEKLEFSHVDNTVPTSDTIGNGYRKDTNAYTGDHDMVIGQAYNKSGLQVLSSKDAADPSTGKRR